MRLSIRNSAGVAEGQRQNEGSKGSSQRRNRPLRHVPVGVFSPKAVQWLNEGQVKAVLDLFACLSAQPHFVLLLDKGEHWHTYRYRPFDVKTHVSKHQLRGFSNRINASKKTYK